MHIPFACDRAYIHWIIVYHYFSGALSVLKRPLGSGCISAVNMCSEMQV